MKTTLTILSFHPFGEQLEAHAGSGEAGERLAHRIGAGVFWILVALIVVGRVCLGPSPKQPAIEPVRSLAPGHGSVVMGAPPPSELVRSTSLVAR